MSHSTADPGARLQAVYPPRGNIVHLYLPGYKTTKPHCLEDRTLCGQSSNTITPVNGKPTGRVKVPISKAAMLDAFRPNPDDPRPAWRWCAHCLGRAAMHYALAGRLIQDLINEDAAAATPASPHPWASPDQPHIDHPGRNCAQRERELLQEDLDLVECTPHAMRGEKWVRASVRLDKAGISYSPGSRYNAEPSFEKIELAPDGAGKA